MSRWKNISDVRKVNSTQLVQNLNANLLEGKSYRNLYPVLAHRSEDGFLVKLNIGEFDQSTNTILINGNAYWDQVPILTEVQITTWSEQGAENGAIWNFNAIHYGWDFGQISAFFYEGYLYLWLEQKEDYYSLNISGQSSARVGEIVLEVKKGRIPAEGVKKLETITPYKGVYSKNGASDFVTQAELKEALKQLESTLKETQNSQDMQLTDTQSQIGGG